VDCANNKMCDEHVKYFESYYSFDKTYFESKKCIYCVYPSNSTSKMCNQHHEDIMTGMCVRCGYNEVINNENKPWCMQCEADDNKVEELCSCGDNADYNGSCISCLKLDYRSEKYY